ncbi:hypothetical protein FHU10_5146 [Serratia fonticola]|jgi:hypothetical protein|uniref:Phage protein Gp138 N-terminal domain-containing protein n=1 Tax=Serratia fonticola TaxID=47917 RepID=A0A542BN38_SERFO|nr:Gp138 family membrane-puncturing spike protein [Serratia fonticola]TQI80003.1 hypothetical protein FHU09_2558 [Serratia fonticola]TQI97971.1 hypothetical protein FHU11_3488 [Serratia fonticola]TVZ72466.1 hypothetical protein FHU10_5146 [Serratia fonticola]
MAETSLTSGDPASRQSLPGVIEFAFKKMLQGIDGQLPAVVVGYDRETNRATVQPLISRLTTEGEPVERATIASVPVLALGGGGFAITFPLKAGDRGWIEASDRDISLFMQTNDKAIPNTLRMHEFSDGRFVPDMFASHTLPAENENEVIIQNKSGETLVGVKDDRIRLVVDSASITIDKNGITFAAGGQTLVFNAEGMHHNGTDVGANHRHAGVQRGNDESGGPV